MIRPCRYDISYDPTVCILRNEIPSGSCLEGLNYRFFTTTSATRILGSFANFVDDLGTRFSAGKLPIQHRTQVLTYG